MLVVSIVPVSLNIYCVQEFYLSVTWELESPQSLGVNISSKESRKRGECNLSKIMGLIRPDEPMFFSLRTNAISQR